MTCDPPTHRVTVKKNSFIRPKKKGVGLGGLGESGDSSGESVWWWSDSGLFAAAAITSKWVGPKTKQTCGSKKRGGCRGGEPRKLLLEVYGAWRPGSAAA